LGFAQGVRAHFFWHTTFIKLLNIYFIMMKRCETCKKETCDGCKYLKSQLYYGYAELRWCFWNYLKQWGKARTKLFYDKLVDEEGKEWANDALGEKLVREICS